MAQTKSMDVLQELMSVPYGQGSGDLSPSGALNRTSADDYVRCYVRNWSANIERDFVYEAVSQKRGGEKSKMLANQKGEELDLETLRIKHHNGDDADIVHKGIKPLPKVQLLFDGQHFEVPASKDPKKDPEWVSVPQGVMDLYFGNVDRLNSTDRMEANREREKVAGRRRHDPCIRKNARGENTNPFGFLEFKREIIEPSKLAVDADSVFTDEYIEV